MKKLRLEALEVTSFETAPARETERGTVLANSGPFPLTRNPAACPATAYLDCTMVCSFDDDTCA